MKILSIDTSSEACSASLNIDGNIITQFELAPQKHSSLILPMCDELLSSNEIKLTQLDAIAFGQGPGSFTGLRIAAGVVQGMAFGADLPVIKVSTLAALAQQLAGKTSGADILATIDARMQEVYWCLYHVGDNGLVTPLMDEAITPPDKISLADNRKSNDPVYAIGSGWKEYKQMLSDNPNLPETVKIYDNQLTSAEEIALLAANMLDRGEVVSADQAIPVYLRNNVAKKSAKKY